MREQEIKMYRRFLAERAPKVRELHDEIKEIEGLFEPKFDKENYTAGELLDKLWANLPKLQSFYPKVVLDAVNVNKELDKTRSEIVSLQKPLTYITTIFDAHMNFFLEYRLNIQLGSLKMAMDKWQKNPKETFMGARKYGAQLYNVYHQEFCGSGMPRQGRKWSRIIGSIDEAVRVAATGFEHVDA